MPLIPSVMSDAIYALLTATPIGSKPVMSVSKTPQADGTVVVNTKVTGQDPVTLDPTLARLIADAVAEGVCGQITSAAVVTGTCPVGPVAGKIS